MDNFNTATNATTKDEWLTPPWLIASLGHFELDPCAPLNRPWNMARYHFCLPEEDGLLLEWFGRVWCNPPYGRQTFEWMEKLAAHGNGIALIFARTETKGFHREIWAKADAVFFFEGRIGFHHIDGTLGQKPNAASCLVAYGKYNVEMIDKALVAGKIKGKLVLLNN